MYSHSGISVSKLDCATDTGDRTIVTVPVEFPQAIRFDVYVGGGSIRHRKVRGRILDLDPTARRNLLRLFGQAEDVRIGNIAVGRHFGLFGSVTLLRGRDGAPEDVGIHGGHLLEIGDVETEILSHDLERGVNEPVGKHEGGPGGVKVTVREQE